jgi:methyl-accepting chemotaxis protein
MDGKLSVIVDNVRGGADAVAVAARQIAATNDLLAQRTHEQTTVLTQAAESIAEMTDSTKRNAASVSEANQLGHGAREQADRGGTVVREAIGAMQEINSASRKIADIINVIDDIAFQTNLLALNAAVEAARAGKQGGGFAVVAIEVRSLAQRSAGAAREIKVLINDSVSKIRDGTEPVNASGHVLSQIVASVKQVTEIVTHIAEANREQAAGIYRLNQVMSQMQTMTLENFTLVEEAANAGKAMEARSAAFIEQVRHFTVAPKAERLRDAAPSGVLRQLSPTPSNAPAQQGGVGYAQTANH